METLVLNVFCVMMLLLKENAINKIRVKILIVSLAIQVKLYVKNANLIII